MTRPDVELPVVKTDRVRFAETDAQGIVFYGTYFTDVATSQRVLHNSSGES